MADARELTRRLREMERVCDRCKWVLQDMRSEVEANRRQRVPIDDALMADMVNRTVEGLVDAFDQVLTNLSMKQAVDRPVLGLAISELVYMFLRDGTT